MSLLSLSTALAPTRKFLVDKEEFEIYGLEHLSRDDENAVVALFARHNVLSAELEVTSDIDHGKMLAERIRKTRIALICKLTSLDKATAEKLPLPQQVQLFLAVQEDVDVDGSSEEEKDAAEDAS